MPDILAPSLDSPKLSVSDTNPTIDFPKWDRPSVQIPDILKQSQDLFSDYPSQNIDVNDFSTIVNQKLTPQQVKDKQDENAIKQSLVPVIPPPKEQNIDFRYFASSDAFRYKRDSSLWKNLGYNPEMPHDLMDAQYDHNESTWNSMKNVFQKMWATASFQFKNYFAEYADTAQAIATLDANVMHDQDRYKTYNDKLNNFEELYPDYKTDKTSKWWQLTRGDFWEESGSSIGFTLGTVAAAVLENAVITLATGGLGELGEIYNTPRKVFNSISDYYSLKRGYGLVKGVIGAKSILGKLNNGINIWRLVNSALSEAAFEGFNNKNDYLTNFKQNYIQKNGYAPSEVELQKAGMAGDKMANATILWETPFLMASNAAQFGNLIAPKTLEKIIAQKGAFELATEGFKTIVSPTEKVIKNPFLKYLNAPFKGIKSAIWEGTEESYQALVTKSTADYYNDEVYNKDEQSIMKSLGVGFDYLNSNTGMKEFSAGFLTGAIFQHIGKPLHFLTKAKSTVNAEGQKEYSLNFFNRYLGLGMTSASKDIEKQEMQKIANKLNSTDIDKVLKEEGLFNLIKDKRTALVLAKYIQNNDMFNMQNTQNLQLNRMLYAGLATGKIDLQVAKLRQFAQQDFSTLKDFFDLDENEYQTPEEKTAFLESFKGFTEALGSKSKDMEKIFNSEIGKHQDILSKVNTTSNQAIDTYNTFLDELKEKYNTQDVDDLNKMLANGNLDKEDEAKHLQLSTNLVAAKFRNYAIQEGLKAAVFAQVGMMDSARRADNTIRDLNSEDNVGVKYNYELSKIFDKQYRDGRISQLETKLASVVDADKSVVQEQLDTFKELSEHLDKNFDEAKPIKENVTADLIQNYFYSIRRELNKLDNNTPLEKRISSEEASQFNLLKNFVKLQKQHQENLNLLNYLSAADNFNEYSNRQSKILTDFFSQAMDIADEEERNTQAKKTITQPAIQPTIVAKQPTAVPQAQVQTTAPAVATTVTPQPIPSTDVKENLKNLMVAIKNGDEEEIDRLKEIAKAYDPKIVINFRNSFIKIYVNVADRIDNVIKEIVGEDYFNQETGASVAVTPITTPQAPVPIVEETTVPLEEEKPEIPKTKEENAAEALEKLIDDGILKNNNIIEAARKNPTVFFDNIARQANNIVDDESGNPIFDTQRDSRNATFEQFSIEVIEKANEFFPEYERIAKEADEKKLQEPKRISEIAPPNDTGDFIPKLPLPLGGTTGVLPLGSNIITTLIDEARKDGRFVFDALNPKEIEMNGSVPKEEDGKIVLKTLSDPILLRHHYIMEHISKVVRDDDDGTATADYKLKLEFQNEDNKEWYYQRDEKSHSILAVLVDQKGDYHYFDKKGTLATKETGYPFAIEYEDSFYTPDNLNISRNSLANGFGTTINSGYNKTALPLMTIVSLLHNKVNVYGSILGVMSGTLSSTNNNNTLNNEKKSTYKMRTVQELIDSGDIEPQFMDVKIDGFYIYRGYPTTSSSDQMVKIGRPYIYDVKSDLYVPLTGRQLKDVTFLGTKIPKSSQLYEIIDILDKEGEINADKLRPDKTRILRNYEDLLQVYQFLREILYSKNFGIAMYDNILKLNRNPASLKANSIWDAEINYVANEKKFIDVPLSNDVNDEGKPTQTSMPYNDFLNENFLTGAAKAIIAKDDIRFTKLNKRILFGLDKTHHQMLQDLSNATEVKISTASTPNVGDWYAPQSNPTIRYQVKGIEDNIAILSEEGEEKEQRIDVADISKRWVKIEKVAKPEPILATEQQEISSKSVESLPKQRVKGKYTVTSLIRPTGEKSNSAISAATVVGNAIDYIAKNIFSDKNIKFSDEIESNGGIKAKIGSYFKSEAHFDAAIKTISKIKNTLQNEGYMFKTGVIVNDKDTGISGEIDLLLISKDGSFTVADFKTANSSFGDSYLNSIYDGVSNRQYFATQGYIYGLMLAKQTGLSVNSSNKIIGLDVAADRATASQALDSKIVNIRDATDYVFNFSPNDIVDWYKKDGKIMTSLQDIVAAYEEVRNKNATDTNDKITDITGKAKKDDSLLMSVKDINIIAASNQQLKSEIDRMSQMFGESFTVNFVNAANNERYGHFNTHSITLYKNAIAGTVYHEGWHRFSQLFLNIPDKLNLYESIRKAEIEYVDRGGEKRNTKTHDDLAVEEMLADEWVKYVQSSAAYKFPSSTKSQPKGIIGLFKRMWKALKEWWNGTKNPTELFKDLYNGNTWKYRKDVNNAIWGNLSSAVLDNNAKEVLNHARSNLYISATSFFIGKILRDNKLSFSWLRENLNSTKIKNLVWNEYRELLASRLAKLSFPVKTAQLQYLLDNTGSVIDTSVREKGIRPENAAKYVAQIMEIDSIMDEENGGFDNFYNFYTRNSDIDSIRDIANKTLDVTTNIDTDEIANVLSEIDEESDAEDKGSIDDEDTDSLGSARPNPTYGAGPNDESAFLKASREIQDFFKTMPIIESVDENGNYTYFTNELDLPETYEYASVFNKTKTILAGKFTIESILAKLANPLIQQDFPQAKWISDRLQEYMEKSTLENFSFIQRFVRVMSLAEINNIQVSLNFDAVGNIAKGSERTSIKMASISRIGESQDVGQWQYNFKRPSEERPSSRIDDTTTLNKVFNDKDSSNILYNVDGVLILNPFYDYASLKMNSKDFLELMGINLDRKFWTNTEATWFADRLKSLFLKNLDRYKVYSEYTLAADYLGSNIKMEDFKNNDIPNREIVEQLAKDLFIQNPIQSFRERRSYRIGDKLLETFSLYTVMEDVSRQNSIYSLTASSRSFTDGAGKLKWPFYENSLIAYRTQLLNDVENIRDFDDNLEYAPLNPNTNPWLKNTLFYKATFDDSGNRRTVSHEIRDNSDNELSSKKVKIELADLSSFKTVTNRKYKTVHPKSLNAQDKLLFDTVTLLTNGFLEVPRAATSSTMFAVKLNSYGAFRQGTDFKQQFLPVDFTGLQVMYSGGKIYPNYGDRFYSIMNGYLIGELQKMKWYMDKNPENKLASNFNIFKDILSPGMQSNLLDSIKSLSGNQDGIGNKIKELVNSKKDDVRDQIRDYFAKYIQDLYSGDGNSNYIKMSSGQKAILQNLVNLYENRTRSQDVTDIAREKAISESLASKEQSSIYQSSTEKASTNINSPLSLIAGVFAANQFILNVEYHNWYMGDNYLFSNPFKRGNLVTNTGILGVVGDNTNHVLNSTRGTTLHSLFTGNTDAKDFRKVKTIVLKDVITSSRYMDIMTNDILNYEREYQSLLSENFNTRKEQILKELNPYTKITAADGQSKINLDAYRTFRKIFGTWNNSTDEKEYQRQLAITRQRRNLYKGDDKLKETDERLIKSGPYSTFNPQKWSYTGPEIVLDTKGNVIPSPMRTKFDKTSLHPLIPEVLLGSGNPDEKLMIDMAMNDVDYAKFESAAKGVKHDDIIEYFDQYGNDNSFKLEDASPEWLISSYVKHQLSTDDKKDENTFGSQQRVMVFDVKYLPEVQNNPKELGKIANIENKYLDAIDNIMGFQRAMFFNRFGLEEKGVGQNYDINISDEERFAAAINSLAKSNNFPTNMLEYLQYNPGTKTYTYDPSLVFNRRVLVDTIGGIIDGDLRRLKTKGIAAIQVTSVGNTRQKFTNPTEDQIKQYGTNGLHYYHLIYDKNGKIERVSTMGIKITLQGDFKNLLNLEYEGKKILTLERLNQAIANSTFKAKNIDKLTFYGYRIPTNNNNFIDHVEVMEFIPESAGNIVVAPMEHIIKSGSDFDVDKLNFIFPSIDNNGNSVTLPGETIKEIYSKMNQITSSIKDYKAVQKQIKEVVKSEKKEFSKLIPARDRIEALLRQEFYNIDHVVYSRMAMNEKKTIYEIIDYFEPFAVDNEPLQNHIKNFDQVNELLKNDKSLLINQSKVDREFQKLLSDLNKYKDYHTNQMLDAMKEVMSHPAYYKMMVSPSNTEYLSSEANRIGTLTNRSVRDNLSSSENMKYTTVNAKHKEYLSDSKDIGAYSIQRIWFSFLNYSKMELNRIWKYSGDSMKIYTPLVPFEKRAMIGSDRVKMYGDNIDGISPRDLWDQFMSLTIDLPSSTVYTLFGINQHNKKVLQYLIASRNSAKSVFDFINQPILQDVYKAYEVNSKEMRDYTLKHAMLDVARKNGIVQADFMKLYDESYLKDKDTGIIIGASPYVKRPGLFANALVNENDFFSPEDMENDISTENKSTVAYKERQKKILLYFMTAEMEAANFTGMQFSFNEDRSKNTNFFTLREKQMKKEQIRGDEYNDLPVDGSMFSKDAISTLENKSIYSMFSYSLVASMFYQQFAKEFTNLGVATSIMHLLEESGTFGIQKQMLATRIEGDFVEFIYKNFGSFNTDIYDPISDTIAPSTDRFGMHFLKRIFNIGKVDGFKTYGEKLIKFLERYPELGHKIEFIQKLYPVGILEKNKKEDNAELNQMDTFSANVIRFNRSQENTVQERNFYIRQFEHLISFNPSEFKLTENYSLDDRKKISAFFTELAYLTLYQSGPTNIADNFSDLLPSSMWQEFSTGAFDNYKKSIAQGRIKQWELLKLFSMLYIENNPKVPWRNDRMIYNIKYFGEKLKDGKYGKIDQENARKSRFPTNYFLNFTVGKMYDVELFAPSAQFKMLDSLYC